jgi:hypothetical protein
MAAIKGKTIKLSSLDKAAPDDVQLIYRLQHPREASRSPPVVIADYTDITKAQAHSDRLSVGGVRHDYVVWWKKEGRHVKKWPTMMQGKARHFRVRVPYRANISDETWKGLIKDGLVWAMGHEILSELRQSDIGVTIDEDRNRGERAMDDTDAQVLRDFLAGMAVSEGSMGTTVYVQLGEIEKAKAAVESLAGRAAKAS